MGEGGHYMRCTVGFLLCRVFFTSAVLQGRERATVSFSCVVSLVCVFLFFPPSVLLLFSFFLLHHRFSIGLFFFSVWCMGRLLQRGVSAAETSPQIHHSGEHRKLSKRGNLMVFFYQPIEATAIYSGTAGIGWPCLFLVSLARITGSNRVVNDSAAAPAACYCDGTAGNSRHQECLINFRNEREEVSTRNAVHRCTAPVLRTDFQQPKARRHGVNAGAAGDAVEERRPDPPPSGPASEAGWRDPAAAVAARQVQERLPFQPESDDWVPHEEQLHSGTQETPSPGHLRRAAGPADPPRARSAEVLRVPQERQVSRFLHNSAYFTGQRESLTSCQVPTWLRPWSGPSCLYLPFVFKWLR